MNGSELLRMICAKEGVDIAVAGTVMRSFVEQLVEALQGGETVTIRGFGRFATHTRVATTRRNPATGAVVKVPEQRVLSFHASDTLRKVING